MKTNHMIRVWTVIGMAMIILLLSVGLGSAANIKGVQIGKYANWHIDTYPWSISPQDSLFYSKDMDTYNKCITEYSPCFDPIVLIIFENVYLQDLLNGRNVQFDWYDYDNKIIWTWSTDIPDPKSGYEYLTNYSITDWPNPINKTGHYYINIITPWGNKRVDFDITGDTTPTVTPTQTPTPTVYITANPDTHDINVSTNFTFTTNPVGSWGNNISYSWSIAYEKCFTAAVVGVLTGQSISEYLDVSCGNASISVTAADEKNNTANGAYLVTVHENVTPQPTAMPTFNISGFKINNATGSGVQGWNITLMNSTMQKSTMTVADGSYKFMNLVNGTYNVAEEMKIGWTNVSPMSQQVTINGADMRNINFTNQPPTQTPAPTVNITANPDTHNTTVSTSFTFTANPAGSWGNNIQYSWSIAYEKCFTAAVILTGQSIPEYLDVACGNATISVTADDEKNNTANDTYLVTVHENATQIPPPVSTFNISGFKINNATGNGVQGWNITLMNSTMQKIVPTAADGSYKFPNLANGTYNVTEEIKTGWTNLSPLSQQITINVADIININFTNQPTIAPTTTPLQPGQVVTNPIFYCLGGTPGEQCNQPPELKRPPIPKQIIPPEKIEQFGRCLAETKIVGTKGVLVLIKFIDIGDVVIEYIQDNPNKREDAFMLIADNPCMDLIGLKPATLQQMQNLGTKDVIGTTIIDYLGQLQFPALIPLEKIPLNAQWTLPIQGMIKPNEVQMRTFYLDNTIKQADFNLFWPGSDMDLVLYTPSGAKINSSVASNNPNINYTNGTTFKSYEVLSPESGNWTMEITAVNVTSTGENYSVITFMETNLFVGVGTNKESYVPNAPITVAAYVQDNGTPLSKMNVTATISRPDGTNSTIQLYDDGLHNDNQSNDGLYANVYTGTSLSGKYYITTSVNGTIGNESFERKAVKTVWVESLSSQAPSPVSSGGGSGGGGGGGTSGENYSNIEVKEKYDLFIFKDKLTSYTFNRSNPIISVNITGNVNAGEVNTAVEVLKSRSSLVKTQAQGRVYKNVNVWVGTAGFAVPRNIKDAVIRFRVDTSWLDSNNIETSSVTMVKWDGKGWNPLETSQKAKDSAYTIYEAKTDGFSHFAITGLSQAASAVMPGITKTQPEITGTVAGTKANGTAPSGEAAPVNLFLVVVVFVVVGIVIAVHFKRKRNFKK